MNAACSSFRSPPIDTGFDLSNFEEIRASLTRLQGDLFAALYAKRGQYVRTNRLHYLIYSDALDGGPLHESAAMSLMVKRTNQNIAAFDLVIINKRWRGYRLERLSAVR